MIAYKGLNKDMAASLGRGNQVLSVGVRYLEESSKTARNGWHCTENPFACLSYFPLGQGNRYFQVEAAGNIDEDDHERIACTELTLLRELTVRELAWYGIAWIATHPKREHWECRGAHIRVGPDTAQAEQAGDIAIARGPHPVVCGAAGSILGLILEPEPGEITGAKLFTASESQVGRRYTLGNSRTLQEVAR